MSGEWTLVSGYLAGRPHTAISRRFGLVTIAALPVRVTVPIGRVALVHLFAARVRTSACHASLGSTWGNRQSVQMTRQYQQLTYNNI